MRLPCDIQYIFSWIMLKQGEKQRALSLAKKAFEQDPANFDYCASFLLCSLVIAKEDSLKVTFNAIEPGIAENLDQAIAAFFPLREKLWAFQDREIVIEVLVNLGYALLIRGRGKEAKKLLEEGITTFTESVLLVRAYLESLYFTKSEDKAYQFGTENLDKLDANGLTLVAEMAANLGDLETIHSIHKRIDVSLQKDDMKVPIEPFLWIALWRNGKLEELDTAFEKIDVINSLSIFQMAVFARIQTYRKKKEDADNTITRMLTLITVNSSVDDFLQASETCLAAGRYQDTVKLLEQVLPNGIYSHYHEKLLFAYIKIGHRKKAWALLHSLPTDSFLKGQIRSLAIELAYTANNWKELAKLADMELEENPNQAASWLIKAEVFYCQQMFNKLKEFLAQAPINLEGITNTISRLAHLELKFNNEQQGLLRIYRRFRENLEDTEAAVNYFKLLSINVSSIFVEDTQRIVEPGTMITLQAHGQEKNIIIDPLNIDLPSSQQKFISATDEFTKLLLGKKVGDKVTIKDTLGFDCEYELVAITSAYRYLLTKATELIHYSAKPIEGISSIPIPQGANGKANFQHIHNKVKERVERAKLIFSAYSEGKLTLGILGTWLGIFPIKLVTSWHNNFNEHLFVCKGEINEQESAWNLITGNDNKPTIIDLMTIAELVSCNCEKILELIAPVFIPQSTLTQLIQLIDETENSQSSGVLCEQEGQLIIIEQTAQEKNNQVNFLRRIEDCIRTYCKSLPVYGPEQPSNHIYQLDKILDKESYELLLLAMEHQAAIFTLDGRLRELAWTSEKIPGYWPQCLARLGLVKGLISSETYSQAMIYQLSQQRSFVSLNAKDLFWLLHQAPQIMQEGFHYIRKALCDVKLEPSSVFRVITDLYILLVNNEASLAVISEIMEKLLASLFLHPSINKETAWWLFIKNLFYQLGEQSLINLTALSESNLYDYLFIIVQRTIEASELTCNELHIQPIQVKALYVYMLQKLIYIGN